MTHEPKPQGAGESRGEGSETPPRLFFALWPAEGTRRALAKLARKALRGRGRLVAEDNLHLTLFFLGSTPPEQQACVERAAARVRGVEFTLALDRLGHFARPRVAWTAPAREPQALLDLASTLAGELSDCGFTAKACPFQGHVTLARKVARAPLETSHKSIVWKVDRFSLVQSRTHQTGVEYRPLQSWRLQPRPEDLSGGDGDTVPVPAEPPIGHA